MSIKANLITGLSYLRHPSKRKLIHFSRQLKGKTGLEIGGPSSLFSLKGSYPVYLYAHRIDGVNFSTETIWEGSIKEGETYRYHNKTGHQYIREATDLRGIESGKYDFVLSCHSLEHVSNPLKALYEWKRVLKPGGLFTLILPDKRYTFDVNREYTTLDHLIKDYEQHKDETDTTHFEEIIATYDPALYPTISSREELTGMLKNNYTTRFVHHHVFSFDLMQKMLTYLGFNILYFQEVKPFHLVLIAQKETT